MGKALRYIVVLLLAAVYFVPKPHFLLTMDFPAHLLHHFWHANVFHFAVNALAVWTVLDPRTRPAWWLLPAGFAIGSLSYCFALKPVIGFSDILFAMAGLRTPSFRNAWWKSTNAKVFIGSMFLMLLLPGFSATTHIGAFALGAGVAFFIRFSKGLDYDTRRAAGGKGKSNYR